MKFVQYLDLLDGWVFDSETETMRQVVYPDENSIQFDSICLTLLDYHEHYKTCSSKK